MGLNFVLKPFDQFYYIFRIFSHIFLKLKIFFKILLLIELNISRFKKMSFDIDCTFNTSFCNFPFRYPLSCIKITKLNVLTCNTNINIKRFLSLIHKNCIKAKLPCDPKGSLKYLMVYLLTASLNRLRSCSTEAYNSTDAF